MPLPGGKPLGPPTNNLAYRASEKSRLGKVEEVGSFVLSWSFLFVGDQSCFQSTPFRTQFTLTVALLQINNYVREQRTQPLHYSWSLTDTCSHWHNPFSRALSLTHTHADTTLSLSLTHTRTHSHTPLLSQGSPSPKVVYNLGYKVERKVKLLLFWCFWNVFWWPEGSIIKVQLFVIVVKKLISIDSMVVDTPTGQQSSQKSQSRVLLYYGNCFPFSFYIMKFLKRKSFSFFHFDR